MTQVKAVGLTLLGVWCLGIFFSYLMGTPAFMTLMLYALAVVLGRYVVVDSYRTYRLMRTLTEE